MKKNIVLIVLLILELKIQAQNFNSISTIATNPPDFSKLSYNEACEIVNKEERKKVSPEYIASLVHQLKFGHLSNDNKIPALYLLGELRPADTNSIEVLIQYIDLKASKMQPLLGPVQWGKYPAVDALIKIGKPAVEPILNHLPQENNELRKQLMCIVLKEVLRNYLNSQDNQ